MCCERDISTLRFFRRRESERLLVSRREDTWVDTTTFHFCSNVCVKYDKESDMNTHGFSSVHSWHFCVFLLGFGETFHVMFSAENGTADDILFAHSRLMWTLYQWVVYQTSHYNASCCFVMILTWVRSFEYWLNMSDCFSSFCASLTRILSLR